MKLSITFLAAYAFLFSLTAQAQTLSETEIKPPFIMLNCATNEGTLGALKINLQQLNISETADQLTLSVKSALLVCAIDSTKKFGWLEANPYAGFQVQYFDDTAGSIKSRKVYIDPANAYNRMGLVTLNNPDHFEGTSSSETMSSTGGNNLIGSVTINKTDILNQKDLAKLALGETVKKIISLYHISNLMTEIDGEVIQLGDENREGRNIILHFKKNGTMIVMTSVDL